MNDTPWPFTVSATSTFGTSSGRARNPANASRNAAWSWPLHRATCQPNAASFASRSPSARISSVGRSDCSSFRSITTQRRADPLVDGCLQRLPVLSLLELPVTGHHDDDSVAAEVPLRPRDSAALRDPHAERAGVRLDARDGDVGVPVEPAESPEAQ